MSENSWWRRAQRRGIDVATVIRRAAGFMAAGGTDAEKARKSRERGEVAAPGEVEAKLAQRRAQVDRNPAPSPPPALEIWVICEELWECRWRAKTVQPVVGDRHLECYGRTAEQARGANFRYRLAHLLQSHNASLQWPEARRQATSARIYVACEIRMK